MAYRKRSRRGAKRRPKRRSLRKRSYRKSYVRSSKRYSRKKGKRYHRTKSVSVNSKLTTSYRRNKRISKIGKLSKMNKLISNFTILRYQGYNPYSNVAAKGWYTLDWNDTYVATDPAVGTYQHMPVHLFDLTSATNYSNGTNFIAAPHHRLNQKTNGSLPFFFENLEGIDPVGGPTKNWHREKTSNSYGAEVDYLGDRSILDWIDVRLLLRGRKNLKTRFHIDMIQLDEKVNPYFNVGFSDVHNGSATFNTFWEAIATQYTRSPLNVASARVGDFKKHMKVFRSWTYEINADSSDDLDPNSVVKHVKIFERMNRMCNWNWRPVDDPEQINNSADYPVEYASRYSHVDPKARIFLMIRADANYNNGASLNDTASYDMVFRVKHIHAQVANSSV